MAHQETPGCGCARRQAARHYIDSADHTRVVDAEVVVGTWCGEREREHVSLVHVAAVPDTVVACGGMGIGVSIRPSDGIAYMDGDVLRCEEVARHGHILGHG